MIQNGPMIPRLVTLERSGKKCFYVTATAAQAAGNSACYQGTTSVRAKTSECLRGLAPEVTVYITHSAQSLGNGGESRLKIANRKKCYSGAKSLTAHSVRHD